MKTPKKPEALFETSYDVKSLNDLPPMNSERWDVAVESLAKFYDSDEGVPYVASEPTYIVSQEFLKDTKNIQNLATFHGRIMEYNGVKYYPQPLPNS